jgi:hypothetical protein
MSQHRVWKRIAWRGLHRHNQGRTAFIHMFAAHVVQFAGCIIASQHTTLPFRHG